MVGVIKKRGCLQARAPHLLSWRGWGLFPVLPSAPLLPSLQYNSADHWSGVSCQSVRPCGHCVCAGESGVERRPLSHRERGLWAGLKQGRWRPVSLPKPPPYPALCPTSAFLGTVTILLGISGSGSPQGWRTQYLEVPPFFLNSFFFFF